MSERLAVSEAEVQLQRKMIDCAVEGANVEMLPQKNNGEDSVMCAINGIMIPGNIDALAEYCRENRIKLVVFKLEMVATWDSRQIYDWTPPSNVLKKHGNSNWKEKLETMKFASLVFALLFVLYQLGVLMQPMFKWIV